jgi:hypothetical protein
MKNFGRRKLNDKYLNWDGWNLNISCEQHLQEYLKKYNIPCYISFKDSLSNIYTKYPFIKNIRNCKWSKDKTEYEFLSSKKLNKKLKNKFIPYKALLSSLTINAIIYLYNEGRFL